MHIKLSIRGRTRYRWTRDERKYKMRVTTQQCPCLKITAGCTAAKFPVLLPAAVKQWRNLRVL